MGEGTEGLGPQGQRYLAGVGCVWDSEDSILPETDTVTAPMVRPKGAGIIILLFCNTVSPQRVGENCLLKCIFLK